MTPFKIEPSGDYVQLIYVDAVTESVQQELRSDTDAFECSYDSDGKLFMQFGAMRFENPEPTDFEIDGSPVTDAADFITKLNALFTGGGGGFPASISQDTEVDLDGHKFQFEGNEDYLLSLSPAEFESALRAVESEGTASYLVLNANNLGGGQVKFSISSFVGETAVVIEGNGKTGLATYVATVHVFTGINDFADDAAAEAGGVPIHGLYHTSGIIKIRLS